MSRPISETDANPADAPADAPAEGSVKVLDARTLSLVGRLWRNYMRYHLRTLAAAIFFMVVAAAAAVGVAKIVEPALDQAMIQKSEAMIWLTGVGFAVLMMIRGFSNYLQTVLMQKVALRSIERMQNEMFSKLQEVELSYLQREGTAMQLSRFSADVFLLREAISKVYTGAGRDIVTAAGMIGLMFYQNWQLAIFVTVCLPVAIYPIIRIGKKLRRISGRLQEQIGQMTSGLDDTLKGARQVRAYNMQGHEKSRASQVFRTTTGLILKTVRTRSASYPIMDTVAGLTLMAVLIGGGHQILEGTQTVGRFMSFFLAVAMAYQPLRSLANLNATLQLGLAAAHRVFTVIDYEPRIKDRPDAKPLDLREARIDLEHVDFAYDEEEPVLRDLSLEIPAGQTVALVGPSGAGKSTVLNLIPRFHDVCGGAVRISGQDVRDVTLHSVAANIALVSQEAALFNDTIRANIAYGRPDASQQDVEEAARNAAAHDFIVALPQGYDTEVGEQGLRLSGGQRQRIAIARALLKDAPILLLDEATSALDAESERAVQDALGRLMVGRTTVVIAHRLATIRQADKICVLDRGRIVQSGRHAVLAAEEGSLYARLCRTQFQISDDPGSGEVGEEPGTSGVGDGARSGP